MFNLAEILTLLIGCLLALVFIDGIRRALRIRRSKLKVDLINPSSEESLDFEEEWQGYEDKEESEVLSSEDDHEEDLDIAPAVNLNIIHLHDESDSVFSESSSSLNAFSKESIGVKCSIFLKPSRGLPPTLWEGE